MRKQSAHYLASKNKQKGTTLLEVVVSMFVVAFGLLAFVAVQLKTQTNIKEASALTVVSNATENLMEGMLANPIVYAPANNTFYRSYTHYNFKDIKKLDCASQTDATKTACDQVAAFAKEVADGLDTGVNMKLKVCSGVAGGGQLPTSSAEITQFMDCKKPDGGGLVAGKGSVIRVAWNVGDPNLSASEGGLITVEDASTQETQVAYTYQLEVNQ